MSEEIARQWLEASATSASKQQLEAHLDLISRRVKLTGVPGFDVIGYDDWARQCTEEFGNGLMQSVRYDGLKMLKATDSNVMFRTWETVEGSDGTVNAQGIEVQLQKEEDGKWRVVEERVLSSVEAARDGLMSTV